jgi:iron(III) transport system substrate-binding protein
MAFHKIRFTSAAAVLAALSAGAQAQGAVNALCSTDAPWCEAAAKEFTRKTGIKVHQAHKGTGEIAAQLRAEANNPKTDIWWGGTGDPFLQAAEQGLLAEYRPAYLHDLHGWSVRQYAMSGHQVGGFYSSAIGFGYNTETLKNKKAARAAVLGRCDQAPVQGRGGNLGRVRDLHLALVLGLDHIGPALRLGQLFCS